MSDTLRSLLYSSKLSIAAFLALYIAFAWDFDYPYWTMMTVYILALPTSGAMHQKGAFMVVGTVAGGSLGVMIGAFFGSDQPLMLAVMLLVLVVATYGALRDRLPSFYMYMLTAITCLLVALPGLDTPDQAFLRAVHRIQDQLVGMTCLFTVDLLLFPADIMQPLRKMVDGWMQALREISLAALRYETVAVEDHGKAVDQAAQLDPLSRQIRYDSLDYSARRSRLSAVLHTQGLRLLPVLTALADVDRAMPREQVPAALIELRAEIAGWLQQGCEPVAGQSLERRLRQLPLPSPGGTQEVLLRLQRRYLRGIHAGWRRLSYCHQQLLAEHPRNVRMIRGARPTPTNLSHVDRGYAIKAALIQGMQQLSFCLLWSFASWDSSFAAMGMLLGTVFFIVSAMADDPLVVLRALGFKLAVALVMVGFYISCVMPYTTHFETLVLGLLPALYVLGSQILKPGAILYAVLPFAMLRLGNNGPGIGFSTLINSGAALAISMVCSLFWMVLMLRKPPGGVLRRLRQDNVADLGQVVQGREHHGSRYAWRALDRFIMIHSRVGPEGARAAGIMARTLRELRAGIELSVVRQQQARREEWHQPLDQWLDRLDQQLRKRHQNDESTVDPALCQGLDQLIERSTLEPGLRRLSESLVALRVMLFPAAGLVRAR
ncbi:FUSC family protein [Frateuria aurantia]